MPVKNTNEQILVVDDDQAIRWTLREALQSWGFEPIEAGTVAEAVTQFETNLPAAVLLDIDLPDGSGLDVLRQIKSHHDSVATLVITEVSLRRRRDRGRNAESHKVHPHCIPGQCSSNDRNAWVVVRLAHAPEFPARVANCDGCQRHDIRPWPEIVRCRSIAFS